jgi:putative FmdB family regulatory protein
MPVYGYRCKDCGKEAALYFELGEAPLEVDSQCECGKPLKRSYSAPGLRFRGSGWARHPEREEANRKKGPQ